MDTAAQVDERRRHANALYDTYGTPLEREHAGEFIAISPDGRVILGPTVLEVLRQAKAEFGPGNFVFKVGQRAVGRWR